VAVDPSKKRVAIAYVSDNGQTYRVVTTAGHASAIGASGAAPGTPGYPRGWKPRHLNLVTADGLRKAKCVVPNNIGIGVIIGQSFSIPGLDTFICTGYTGEKLNEGAPSAS